MEAYFDIRGGTDPDQEFPLESPLREIRIGRAAANDLVLNAPEVSRSHALLSWDEEHHWLTDLQSTTGTRVNQQELVAHTPRPLDDGDIIGIGPFELRFRLRRTISDEVSLSETVVISPRAVVGQPVLRITTPQWTRDFYLNQALTTLGRDPDNDICIDLPTVSGRHACITQQSGAYELVDLESVNGLICKGQRVKQMALADGELIQIGPTISLLFLADPPLDVVPIAYNSVIKSLRDGVLVLDVEDRVMDLNPSAQEIIGLSLSQAAGRPVDSLLVDYPDLLERYHRHRQAAGAEDISMVTSTSSCLVKRGQASRYFDINVSSLYDEADRPAGYLIVMHDITRQRQAALELRQAKETAETYLQKLQQELAIGKQIQREFLPQDLPQHQKWEFATCFLPARDVAGDFYDVFPLPGDCIGLVIGDVSDKGVGSALFMALFRSMIRIYAEQSYLFDLRSIAAEEMIEASDQTFEQRLRDLTYATPLKAVSLANNYIVHNHGNSNMFATMFFGVLDPNAGTLSYINGGHERPAILRQGKVVARLDPSGPAVGWINNAKFEVQHVRLEPGDIFMAYTDGVTDARSPEGKFFREASLLKILEQPIGSATELLRSLEAQVLTHIASANQFDDITMLGVRRVSA